MTLSTFFRDLHALLYFDNRWTLLLERVSEYCFRQPLGLSVYRTGGMEILMDKTAGDQSGARYAITSQMYRQFLPYITEKLSLRKQSSQPNPNDGLLVWDIGANVGGFSLMLALEGLPLRRVVSVEMHPRTFMRLELNLMYNLAMKGTEVRCSHAAIAGQGGLVNITLSQRGNTGDSIVFGHMELSDSFEANCIITALTLDQFYEKHLEDYEVIDICKMDIEGAEYGIFSGGDYTSLARCRFLVIEVHPHPEYKPGFVLNALIELGFRHVELPSSGQKRKDPVEEDVFLFENTALLKENATLQRHYGQ